MKNMTACQSIVAICALVMSLLTPAVSAAQPERLKVRVDATKGAPRLLVNDQPVRARIFWGAPGSVPLPVSPAWQEVSFEFVADGSATNGTMHFRFGSTAGELYLDDIRVADLDPPGDMIPRCTFEGGQESFKRDWTYWPPSEKNSKINVAAGAGRDGSAALHVSLKAPPDGKWPDFHIYHHSRLKVVKNHRYRVSFWARAEPARDLTVAFYQPGETYTRLGGPPDCFVAQIKLAAQAGVNLVSFPIETPWPKPGATVNWASVDLACETVLKANPKALLLPRMGMDPPQWWRAAHPDEVMQWEDGHRDKAVVASPIYRREASERLTALVAHLEEKYGEQVAGYHPCGQNTGEWFYEDTWKQPLNGYAPADLVAWRQWLKKRYANEAALRQSWSNPQATMEAASVPTPAARHAAPFGIFRDPTSEQPLVDWAQFQQESMAQCVCDLAHAVRQASQGRKLVVFFYGYVFEFGAIQNGPSVAGHYNLRRALDCPDIDVLCSPISYFDRGLGQSAPSMTAAESVAMAGKMWLNEDDTHTYLAKEKFPGHGEHVEHLEETNAELARNVAQAALRNFGTWWMDLGASGWFNDPGMWTLMKRLSALDEPLMKTPTPFRPEVASVIDEASMLRVAAGGTKATAPGVYEARGALGRMGAPYGQYLLDDVAAGRVQAKLYVFLNAWSLSAAERAKLLRATHGATRIWCYAPGYLEENHTSLGAMRELTGFALKEITATQPKATPTPAAATLGLRQKIGTGQLVRPLFAVTDAAENEALARYPDGSVAVAIRRNGDGTSIFVGTPGLTSELLKVAARAAGVHLFADTDCIVYANGPFLALHASQDGPVAIVTGRASPIMDLLSGTQVGTGPKATIPLKRGETKILRY